MLISFRGYVLAFGKPDVKMADAAVAASAASDILVKEGLDRDLADKYVKNQVAIALELNHE